MRRGFGKRRGVISAQAGNIVSTRYKSRMLRPRGWSRALVVATRFKPHYRSLLTASFTQVTAVGVNAATKTGLITLLPNLPNPFWIVAGGALPIETGVAVPAFDNSSIVLRGGRSEVTIAVPGIDGVKVKVFMLYIKEGADQAGFNALTTVPTMWDPSHFVDFSHSFKLLSSQEYIMLPGSRPVALIKSFRAQKIDYNAYAAGEQKLAYCFTIQQLTDADVLPASVIFTVSHSISFSGDVL